jgi:chemotaxis protein CheY-P-specific phosphatase CheC
LNLNSLNSNCLSEIIARAAEQAAIALQDIVNQPVDLFFPEVRLINESGDVEVLGELIDKPGTVVKLKFDGGLKGAGFLIFSDGQDQKLVNGLVGQNGLLKEQLAETSEGIFNEVGNVLLNIYVGTIANQVKARVTYDVPHLFIHENKKKWALELIRSHIPPQQLLLLKSSLGLGNLEITAHIVIIMDYSSEVAVKLC